MAILIRGDRIESVGPERDLARPDGARLIDLSGRTVLPGFIDCHDHLTLVVDAEWKDRPVQRTSADAAILGTVNARRTLRAGFTTVRDLGDDDGASIALRRAIDLGLVDGPRIVAAREMLSITGGHGDDLERSRPDLQIAGGGNGEAGGWKPPGGGPARARLPGKERAGGDKNRGPG